MPADWQHPKGEGTYRDGSPRYRALFDGASLAPSTAEWDEGAAKWAEGLRRDYSTDGWKPLDGDEKASTYAEWAGDRPDPDDYMPDWPESERTHFQMYETTSEGTPISPPMESPEALARWLVDNNASAFADQTASYEGWLRVANGGYECSAVMVIGGPLKSGVDGL